MTKDDVNALGQAIQDYLVAVNALRAAMRTVDAQERAIVAQWGKFTVKFEDEQASTPPKGETTP